MKNTKIGVVIMPSTCVVDKKCPKCNINMFIYTGNPSSICYVCKICGHRDYNIEYIDERVDMNKKQIMYSIYDGYPWWNSGAKEPPHDMLALMQYKQLGIMWKVDGKLLLDYDNIKTDWK